ncbi:aminoglycoside phosphotransferase family protein [Streptomyces sp. NPDC048659]|uniref:aminoglycoside phosphotransferase family protein n=1 Tax=Streptomyces sp. NPDC048659 TaxID=3155489 RepID=UPI003426B9DD
MSLIPDAPAPPDTDTDTDVDVALVRRLVAAQFPRWAGAEVRAVESAGTDNAMFRLGDRLVVRLPKAAWAVEQVENEARWLPALAGRLPLPVPVPVALGEPGEGYGRRWGVYEWLDGDDAVRAPVADPAHAAVALGRFVAALRAADATGAPRSFRGGSVAEWAEGGMEPAVRELAADGTLDATAALAAWESVLALPQWDGPPVWIHGDLLPGNVLTRDGRLSAVIDFGGLGTGDPACDLLAAWSLLTPATRPLFRESAGADDATWARGRGWALGWGVVTEAYYRHRNPVLAAVAHRTWTEALPEYA